MSKSNKYINLSYQLYDTTDGKSELIEQTTDKRPFNFISGLGIALQAFEDNVTPLEEGANFEFEIPHDQAYGNYDDSLVIDLDKSIFAINGKFDEEHIKEGAVVPLQNADGNRFFGHVLKISDTQVKMDLNHPLAGKDLKFMGHILETRKATEQELADYEKMIHGQQDGGGCSCGDCENGGSCNGSCGDDQQCCGNCH
nr:FKBP-type peptidyl-prolyl cis-trans isomerase [Prevotella sp. UBA5379]